MSAMDTAQQEALDAASGGARKGAYVRRTFSEIAPSYDLLNHLLSANVDRRWRRKAIAMLGWQRAPRSLYVDLCAGTMDVAAQLARTGGFEGRILAADFAEPMLRAGRKKVHGAAVAPAVSDAVELPLRDGSAAGAIVAFGIRNLADLDAGLREVFRVLEPGARFIILEFSMPRSPLLSAAYRFYFRRMLPAIGRLVSGHPTAYQYLPASVTNFPVEEVLAARLRDAGFTKVQWRSLSFGIAAIHVGIRPMHSSLGSGRSPSTAGPSAPRIPNPEPRIPLRG